MSERTFIEAGFWVLAFACFYVHLGYPLLLKLLTMRPSSGEDKVQNSLPTVTLIITAFNEEKSIEQRILNALSMDYPADKLEIIIASDGSTDKTDSIVAGYASRGVRLIRRTRGGKTRAQNHVIPQATGALVALSDATSMFEPQALKELACSFADPEVGCAVGQVAWVNQAENAVTVGHSFYWRYEVFIRERESRIGGLFLSSGQIMCFRKELFETMDPSFQEDDFLPMKIVSKGFRVVYARKAVARDTLCSQAGGEIRMRSRNGNMSSRAYMRMAFEFVRARAWMPFWCLLSHKLGRFLVPIFLGLLFLVNLFLIKDILYSITFIGQLVFYGCAIIGCLALKNGKSSRVFVVPYYFCLSNIGLMAGALRAMRGEKQASWEPAR